MPFAVDLHTHTRYGSNCSYMHPEQLVRQARETGLDAVCITEHNAPWEEDALRSLRNQGDPLILSGLEVSTQWGDVLAYSANGSPPPSARLEELRRWADSAGGFLVAAHPFRRYLRPGTTLPSIEEMCENPVFRLVDAVEVFNGMGSRPELELACRVVRRLDMPGVAGSDSHAPHVLGRCYTVLEQPIASLEGLLAQLRAGSFRAVHASFDMVFPI